MKRTILITVLALFAVAAYAQQPAEMKKLDWLVGDWSGEAWIQMGPKKEGGFQTERVQKKLGGDIIVIDGLGKRKNEDGTAGDVVHEAFGVISWDATKKVYRFDAWTAREGYVAAWMTVGDDRSATWGFDTPSGGKVRYTIKPTANGEWNEIGEFSRDGNTYMKFFEMTLKKK